MLHPLVPPPLRAANWEEAEEERRENGRAKNRQCSMIHNREYFLSTYFDIRAHTVED